MAEKDDKFVEMMDMMVRMQLIKSIDKCMKKMAVMTTEKLDFRTLDIHKLHDITDAFEKFVASIEEITEEKDA